MTKTGSNSVTTEQRGVSGVLCPYCGHSQAAGDRCESCRGLFEPLSRQASQNAMGPWFIRDEENPFRPGCSFQTIQRLAARNRLHPDTIIRGPSTRQFWAAARDVPGVANLLGECHNCHGEATRDEYMCRACSAVFVAPADRQQLGLAPVRLLPGEASPEAIAQAAAAATPRPAPDTTRNGPGVASQAPRTVRPPAPPAAAGSPGAPSTTANPQMTGMRRLRRQLSNMRALATLLAIVVCIQLGAIVLLAAFAGQRLGGEVSPDAAATPNAAPDTQNALPTPDPTPQPPVTGPDATSSPDAAPQQPPASEPGASVSPDEISMAIEQAIETASGDTIDDLERAVRSLELLRGRMPEDQRPAELDEQIRRFNERIRELSLSRFHFEGPDAPSGAGAGAGSLR